MGDFYLEMEQAGREMNASTANGGLGQGTIVLARTTLGSPNPDAPFDPVSDIVTTEPLLGSARGVSEQLVGTEVDGAILSATDLVVTVSPPRMGYSTGDVLTLDGVPVHILAVSKIPAVGITSLVKFYVKG